MSQFALTLLDLCGASGRSTIGARARVSQVLPDALAGAVREPAHQDPNVPDLLAGAWLLLQSRWLGIADPTFVEIEPAPVGGGVPTALTVPIAAGHRGAFVGGVGTIRTGSTVRVPVDARESFAWARAGEGSIVPEVPLVFRVTRIDGLAHLVAEFDAARIAAAAAQAMVGEIIRVAEALAAEPDATLETIPPVSDAERHRLLDIWNSRPDPPDAALTIDSAFRRIAQAHPDRIAVASRGGRWSYAELDRYSDAIAARLREGGVHSGSVVAVALPRSAEALASLLAVLKAGAAYLPVDPAQPPDRLAFMTRDAGAVIAIAPPESAARLPGDLPVVSIGSTFEPTSAPLPADHDGASLAYVMYTSGSTGSPKGIEIPHRAILRLVLSNTFMNLSPGRVVLQTAPLGFDASTLEIWGPLLNGGTCVIHDEDVPSGPGLAATIARFDVNAAWLTAALFNAIVDVDPQSLERLDELLIGGEALSVAHVQRFLDAAPRVTLINGYGPTECTTFTATYRIPRPLLDLPSIPIGRPIRDTRTYVLSPGRELLPGGLVGELYVGGSGVARGYVGRPDLTAERFISNPFVPGEVLYRTGDLVRQLETGDLLFVGRTDDQVKISGYRIEPGEIERAIASHPAVTACAVIARRDGPGPPRLAAYVVTGSTPVAPVELRSFLTERLPAYMVPGSFVWMDRLPVTSNGKLDRRALPVPTATRPEVATEYAAPRGDLEQRIAGAFAIELGLDRVGRFDNFFELGGTSLQVVQLVSRLSASDGPRLSANSLFHRPTPEGLAQLMSEPEPGTAALVVPAEDRKRRGDDPIAIIAMTGRFPGAASIEDFWRNLSEGRDCITTFGDADLDPSLPPSLTQDPAYVKRRGVIDDVARFDAAFFGISPREAELMDPQQRMFLELCWECLERGGHAPGSREATVGVFGGMYNATYYQHHISHHPDRIEQLGPFAVMLANEKDYIATRAAHKLNLTGPAVSVHTACSTSLVAVAQAVAALRSGECDMALAGGVSITCPPRSGYLHQDGAMLSPDGHTRTFAADAQGTVFSDGAAVVLLKRLDDALADGDPVHAVIRGIAVNNDGIDKASFTAPSVQGQATVIRRAYEQAGIDPRTVSYIEAHGTATPLGDPVEVEALTRAFRHATADRGFCRIGSLKSNVGHMVIAAGAAGLIKTALALEHELIPATLHCATPNPRIDFASGPFIVNNVATSWPRTATRRRAGVSSFGVGGTNAHAVIEEAPSRPASTPAEGPQLLCLSARTATALAAAAERLAEFLATNSRVNLADVAHTLWVGRRHFAERLVVAASDAAEATAALRTPSHSLRSQHRVADSPPPLVWTFPGQGAQYVGMGRMLYGRDAAFRAAFDDAVAYARDAAGADLADRIFRGTDEQLRDTATTQPALFCIEYALAQAWIARGIQPDALIGHSVGEFVAAVLAGVMSLADAARLVAVRGSLMGAQPAGSMLAVRLPADRVVDMLPADLCLAADNGPLLSVVAGPTPAIDAFRQQLEARGVMGRALHTSHAFHSPMMDGALAPFAAEVQRTRLSPPRIPIASTVTGSWLTADQATDPRYWVEQLRNPVRFAPAVRTAMERWRDATYLEVGPRGTLTTLTRQSGAAGSVVAVASLGDSESSELAQIELAQGVLWTLGAGVHPTVAWPPDGRRRISLPTYPFEGAAFWLDAPAAARTQSPGTPAIATQTIATAAEAPDPTAPVVNDTMTSPIAGTAPRMTRLIPELRTVFEELSGLDLSSADPTNSFVELGLDSLTLTQAALQVKKHFKVPLTFRQLMEEFTTLTALATHLDSVLPAETAPAPAAAVSAAPAATTAATVPANAVALGIDNGPSAAPPGFVQKLIEQQMQLMAQQLALLGGRAISQPPVAVAAAAAAAPAPTEPTTAVPDSPRVEPSTDGGPVKYDVKKAFGAIARIHTQPSALHDRQKARLDAFMRRYIARTAKSKTYTEANRSHLADPRVVNGFRPMTKEITYQIVIERSKGARLWDLDGNEYVDALNGFGMNLFGWQPDFVLEAVKRQIDSGYDIGPQHPLAGPVARLICDMTGFDRAALCNTGSEAVMAAVRIARTVTGRNTLVLFTGSYHGTFDEVVVRAGRNAKGIPGAPGILSGMFGDVRVLDYGTPESLEFIRSNADDIAAVLVEPVQSRRPDFAPLDFLRDVRTITEQHGACLIFDEVITGFRSHLGGSQALFGIRADLASYGKVIGGGMPIGAVAGKRAFMDALDGGGWQFGDSSIPTVGVTYFAGTFVRHPLALAAAHASLEHLKAAGPELQTSLNDTTAQMAARMNAYCERVGAPIAIRHFASLWRVSWLEDHPLQDLLFAMMRSRGIHILDNFPCFMTTAHSASDIDRIEAAFRDSVAELQEGDFLPRRAVATTVFDPSHPPVANARLGRGRDGQPAWFVPDESAPGKYRKYLSAEATTVTR